MTFTYNKKIKYISLLASLLVLSACADNVSDSAFDYYAIGGQVSGLEGVGLTLLNSNDDKLIVTGSLFIFNKSQQDNTKYEITISEQPKLPSQTCELTRSASGLIQGAAISDIAINCNTNTYVVGGRVTGLVGSGLQLTLNEQQALSLQVSNGNPSFSFSASPLVDETEYRIAISKHPVGQTCAVATEDGIDIKAGIGVLAGKDIGNIGVHCVNNFSIGGNVRGMDESSTTKLVLQNNGSDDLTISMNGDFIFDTPIADGSEYAVSVLVQPKLPTQTCTVNGDTNNKAVQSENVTTVKIICSTNQYSVGGTVTGLVGSGLTLKNAGQNIPVSGVDFNFQAQADGSVYLVTIGNHPVGQSCEVTAAGSGRLSGAPISNVVVACNALSLNVATSFAFKKILFTWDALPGIRHYKILENPDGVSGFKPLVNSGDIVGNNYSHEFGVHLFDQANARFRLEAYEMQGGTPVLVNSSEDFVVTDSLIKAIGYFKAAAPRSDDQFGTSVSINADGLVLAIGATAANNRLNGGKVFIYERSSSDTTWSLEAIFDVPDSSLGLDDWFGSEISLSADGSTLAVGAKYDDSSAIGVYNVYPGQGNFSILPDAGAVYIYSRNTSNRAWDSSPVYIKAPNTGRGDKFGTSVSLSGNGNTLVVGAGSEDSAATGLNNTNPGQDDDTVLGSGAAYVYSRDATTGLWVPKIDYIKASLTISNDRFGSVVKLSLDGNVLAVEHQSGVHLYTRSKGIWNTNFDIFVSPRSGFHGLDLDDAGDTFIISGFREFGELAVFTRETVGGTWGEQPRYFKHSNPDFIFYNSVSISGDGNTFGILALRSVSYSDAAFQVFTRNNISDPWYFASSAANVPGENISFGSGLSFSRTGNTLVVGASRENSAATGFDGNSVDGCNNNPPTNCLTLSGAAFVY